LVWVFSLDPEREVGLEWILRYAMVTLCFGLLLLSGDSWAFSSSELMNLSLEELMEVEVSSVGRKLQKVSEAPAAVYVISQEDIRRSGATSIPEALRLAPGLSVARVDGSTWSVSSRGFNGRFLNKLQVLIDGRSVYSPPFSAVYWDMQDTLLDDIERIEVVRGPGGTLWGANAVNGVINVITKKAKDTQGGLVKAGYGTEEEGFSSVRYGDKAGDRAYYRAFVKYFNRGRNKDYPLKDNEILGNVNEFGEAHDDWNAFRGGFRLDAATSAQNDFTLLGEAYSGTAGTNMLLSSLDLGASTFYEQPSDTKFAGGYLLGRWQHEFADDSNLALQVYYDRGYRDQQALAKSIWDVLDVDFQHRLPLGSRQELLWGLGYRLTSDELEDGELVAFTEHSTSDQLFSLFVQDEISLIPDKLRLLVGSKFEHNDYSGFEYQPNLRLIWTPSSRHSLWGAVSRAVRIPSQMEASGNIFYGVLPPDLFFPSSGLPTKYVVSGSEDFDSEKVLSYELGYRFMPHSRFSIDTALFYSSYRDHRSAEEGSVEVELDPFPVPKNLLLLNDEDNKVEAESWGLEVAIDWQVRPWWQLQGSYSLMKLDVRPTGDSSDLFSAMLYEESSPQQQWSLRSSFDIGRNWDLDLWLRYVDPVTVYIVDIDNYYSLDVRLAWRPLAGLELALVGQNLLEEQHTESQVEFGTVSTGLPRGFYGQIKWEF
jgi:iron complex outermembrane receptor protein